MRETKELNRGLWLLIGGIACGAVLLGTALGAVAPKYVSTHKAVPSGEPGRSAATAICPSGRKVTGGGVEIAGSDVELEVGSTLPKKRNKAWAGGGNNTSGSPADMTVTAICSKGKFTYKTTTKKVPFGKFARKIVSCPPGTFVVGGGAGAPGDHGVEMIQSEPRDGRDGDDDPDDGWLGGENNSVGTEKPVTMTVTAICSKHKVKRITGKAKIVPLDTVDSATVMCPAGTHVSGGGSHTKPHSTDIEIGDSFPIDGPDADNKPDDGWEVDANNDGGPAQIKLRSIAFCVS
jgi:hypothetical protein